MFGFLKNLFVEKPPAKNQKECEAFVDAIVYCMIVDRRIEPEEMELVEGKAHLLPWKSTQPVAEFVRESMTRAVQKMGLSDKAIEYCKDIRKRLRSEEVREYTLKMCERMVEEDGVTRASESQFLTLLTRRLRK